MVAQQLTLIQSPQPEAREALILSASRRTDLPGFHPDRCVSLIRNKINRLRTRFLHSIVFWTKSPSNFIVHRPLRTLVGDVENPILQLTITGLGATCLEPGIPKPQEILAFLPDLICLFKDDPRRIRWRFDPIVKDQNGIIQFESVARVVSKLGIRECTISFPTYYSLKGDLTAQFNTVHIPKWEQNGKRLLLKELVQSAQSYDITLLSCAQPGLCRWFPEIVPATCIDGTLLKMLHPEHLPLTHTRDAGQRSRCRCIPSEDIGSYRDHPCHGGCGYCYSEAGGPIG